MQVSDLPTLNAFLNCTSAVLIVLGYSLIKKRNRVAHRNAMLGALTASALFLASYLIYHYNIGSKSFEGEGIIRLIYFSVLISHSLLAMAIVPLVALTVFRAFQGDFVRHMRIAKWTLPCWLYVSVTGVVIYWMLYRM